VKITYSSPGGRIKVEHDVSTVKQAFEFLAAIEEIVEVGTCGLCKSAQIRHDVRQFDNNLYFKLVCCHCGGQCDFGQHKDGKNLFRKSRDGNLNRLPAGGWYLYKPQQSNGLERQAR